MGSKKIFLITVVVVVLGLAGLAITQTGNKEVVAPGTYDKLATCIADSGAKFYGAFWCPVCNSQKESFGSSKKLLPYIECSTLDRKNQTVACMEAGIEKYPTWEFVGGERVEGALPIEALVDITGCSVDGAQAIDMQEVQNTEVVEDETLEQVEGEEIMETEEVAENIEGELDSIEDLLNI